MKNKKFLYILLPAVLVIWGSIFYKIYTSVKGTDIPESLASMKNMKEEPQEKEDTFSLLLNYRDPFLGKHGGVVNRPAIKASDEKTKVQKIQWPNIIYHGFIKNKSTKKVLALLEINGRESNIAAGNTIEGVSVKKIFKDSIIVAFKGEKKTIKK